MRFPSLALLLGGSLAVTLVAGCNSSGPKPKEATDAELAPVDQDGSGNVLAPETPSHPAHAPAPVPERPAPTPTAGPSVTLIYVTAIGNRTTQRSAAVIFSSDPDCPYFENERPRPSRILKPTLGSNMVQMLNDLRGAGLSSLPSVEQKVDDPITRDRQIIIVRDEKRICYRQADAQADSEKFQAFKKCETVLIDYSRESATFVETEGLHPADKATPPKR